MSTFDIRWSLFGTATINAPTEEMARERAVDELMSWSGFGLDDVDDLQIDGGDFEIDSQAPTAPHDHEETRA